MSTGRALPISAVVPTIERPGALRHMLESLLRSECFPVETVIVDASRGDDSRKVVEDLQRRAPPGAVLRMLRAAVVGAARQRNQGCATATQPAILFLDDDVVLEQESLAQLWNALQSDARMGGVCATIVNQRYAPPGFVSRQMFWLMNGRKEKSYAGRLLGPAINLLPEDRDDLPAVVPVDWMNLGATLYRREALPEPPFDARFTGYSLLEDATLSARVGEKWKLANARTARITHDSQPGAHKSDVAALSCMELVNRHYLMTKVLGRSGVRNHLRLLVWELFQIVVCAANPNMRRQTTAMMLGKARAVAQLLCNRG